MPIVFTNAVRITVREYHRYISVSGRICVHFRSKISAWKCRMLDLMNAVGF